MRREFEIEYTTIRMTGTALEPGEIVASEDEWFDTQDATSGVITGQFLYISANLTFYWETAPAPEGPWTTIKAITSANAEPVEELYGGPTFLTSMADSPRSQRFDRYVRWRVVATDDAQVCLHGFAVFQ